MNYAYNLLLEEANKIRKELRQRPFYEIFRADYRKKAKQLDDLEKALKLIEIY
jgi:hypothetical protein